MSFGEIGPMTDSYMVVCRIKSRHACVLFLLLMDIQVEIVWIKEDKFVEVEATNNNIT